MSSQKRVVWSEGMLMLPQHFQQQTRYFEHLIHSQQMFCEHPLWGVSSLDFDRALLNTGKISIAQSTGFFQDGSFFDIPDRDTYPKALEISEHDCGQIIYLCLNVFRATNTEINRDKEKAGRCRYLLEEMELRDITHVDSQTDYVEVSGFNLRLLKEKDDRSEFLSIPLTQVNEVSAEGAVTLTTDFIPATLNVKQSRHMVNTLEELDSIVRHRAEAISARVSVESKAVGTEVSDFLMLQCLNRYLPKINHCVVQATIHPYSLFLLFIEIIGEFSTFTQTSKLCPALPDYDHNQLSSCLNELVSLLKDTLSTVLEQRSVNIALKDKNYGVNVGVISDKSLLTSGSFILAVSADMVTDDLRKFFPAQVKIGAVEQIKELVNVQLPGIKITSLAVAPRQIPYQKGTIYYELVQKGEYWQSLKTSGGIAIHVGGKFPHLKLELWAIRAN